MHPLRPAKPGRIYSEDLNRHTDETLRQGKLTAEGATIDDSGTGVHITIDRPDEPFYAKLTSESSGKYAWSEVDETLAVLTSGRTGTTAINYAEGLNGETGIPVNTIVRMWKGELVPDAAATDKISQRYRFSVSGGASGTSARRYCRVATTANISLSTALENGDTLNGVTLATGDRVLVKDQSAPAENGIYVVAASGTAARATDADSWDELVGALVAVSEGTAKADSLWLCTSNAGGTLGSTAVTWSEIGASGSTIFIEMLDYTGTNGLEDGFCGTLVINGGDTQINSAGPMLVEITGTAPSTATLSVREASAIVSGVVSTSLQGFSGVKQFADGVIADPSAFDSVAICLYQSYYATGDTSVFSTARLYDGVATIGYAAMALGYWGDDNAFRLSFGITNSTGVWPGNGAAGHGFYFEEFNDAEVSFVICGPSARYCVYETTGMSPTLYEGASGTVSGLVFVGGLYTSGTLSVTVAPGDITGLDEAIDDRVGTLITAGAHITVTYNDGAGTLTIAAAGTWDVADGGTGRTSLDSGQLLAGAGTSAVDSLSSTRVASDLPEFLIASGKWLAFSKGSF